MATDEEHQPVQEEQQQQHEHEHDGAEFCEQHQAVFDLTVLVPKARFGSAGLTTTTSGNSSSEDSLDSYIPLFIPAGGADLLRDLKQTVAESTEGFWIGAFSFQRVLLKEEQQPEDAENGEGGAADPKITFDGKPSETLSDHTDLAKAFADEIYRKPEVRRVLKVVEALYTDLDVRNHVIRLRDASLGYNVALQSKRLYQPPPYDPNALVVDGGLSIFSSLRGPVEDDADEQAARAAEQEPQVTGHTDANTGTVSGKKGKGKGKGKPAAPAPAQPSTPIPKPAPSAPVDDSSTGAWLSESGHALDVHLARRNYLPASSLPPPAYKTLQVSVYNPPPHHLRMRGHFLYLNATTLEGESLHITACQQGFYVNKSDNHSFDPSPRTAAKANAKIAQNYHSLFALLAAVSPQFSSRTEQLMNGSLHTSPDIFASIAVTNCPPSAPWLVEPEQVVPDSSRSQLSYLLTGSTGWDTMPVARDWNEECTAMRELPKSTNDERLVRDRFAARLSAEFQTAAARGVQVIARGDVAPLNAMESIDSRSYLFHNILFTQAQDSIDLLKHAGGDEAARVSAAKDLRAATLVCNADIPSVHTIATAVIDYAGERWVAQAIPPGIFNRAPPEIAPPEGGAAAEEAKDEKKPAEPIQTGLRAVYGPRDTDKPADGYVADESFAPLAKQIAQNFHLAKHTVTDTKDRKTELWTPADMHGVQAADGRSYVIDLFRLFPVDVNFLEQNMEGKIFSEGESTDASTEEVYPHRMVLLRPELVESYHAIKTREWIEEQVKEKSAQEKPVAKASSGEDAKAITGEEADKSLEGSDEFVKVDGEDATPEIQAKAETAGEETKQPQENEQTIIDVGNFKLAFNPDAFVDRADLPLHSAALAKPDEEEASTKAVRDASTFLRETVVPSLLREILADEIIPLDSSHLSQLLHRKGINVRYLGLIAEETKKLPANSEKSSDDIKQEALAFLAKFRESLVRDMVVRASKHVLRRLIAGSRNVELAEIVSHFLNCLLGSEVSASPAALDSTSSQASWTKISPQSLKDDILAEAAKRFRYAISPDYFGSSFPRPQILRELCINTGLQLALRKYQFERMATPQLNGAHHEDESKQKSSGKKQKKDAAPSTPPTQRTTTFVPEDIVNVYPVAKKVATRSALTEELFERGQVLYIRGSPEHGEAFVADALNFYEQIFGSVHPELAEAYRTLANLYHRLAQPLVRRIQLYESLGAIPREEDRARARRETGFENEEAVAQAKQQHEAYLYQAARFTRQAVIISERTTGLDSPETLQCYTDLAIFEHSVGNIELAMRLLRHAVGLSTATYGENHPEKAKAAYFAATMMKSAQPTSHAAAIPFYKSAQELSAKAYGPNSLVSGNSAYQLAQCYIVDGQLAKSVPYIAEALRIFETRTGKESENAREASQLLMAVKQAIAQREQGELDKVQKLAKRIGSDPARAKELMNKIQGRNGAGGGSAGKKAVRKEVEDAEKSAAAAAASGDTTGSKGHLDVDELVNFITGAQGQSKGKGTGKKAGAGKR